MTRLFVVVMLWVLAGCSNPLDTPLPRELDKMESIKPAMQKLSQEEQGLVTAYIMRQTVLAKFGGLFGNPAAGGIPEGMTLGKAIEDQRGFEAEKKAKADAEAAAAGKKAAQRKALADEFAKQVALRLVSVELHEASFSGQDVNDYLKMVIEIENKGDKEIAGLKGTLALYDAFGDLVASRGMKFDQRIKAGDSARVTLVRDYNKFREEDRKEAAIDADKVRSEFVPSVVLFADGTKAEPPAGD